MKRMVTKNLIDAIREISLVMKDDSDIMVVTKLLREYSNQLGIDSKLLLKLSLNKELLYDLVMDDVQTIDSEISKKEDEIKRLKEQKNEMTSLICELHDHTFKEENKDGLYTCTTCGQTFYLNERKKLCYFK